MKVGQIVLLHRKNDPVKLMKKLWLDCDFKKVNIQDLWVSLKVLGAEGVIKAIYGKDIYVDFGNHGIWCLEEKMLEAV